MGYHVCYYEDNKYSQFSPLSLTRPVYMLRAGILPLFEQAERRISQDSLTLLCRTMLGPIVAEKQPQIPVNIVKMHEGDVLLLNGRLRLWGDLPQKIHDLKFSTAVTNKDQTVAVVLKEDIRNELPAIIEGPALLEEIGGRLEDLPQLDTEATLYSWLWEFVDDIDRAITEDFAVLSPGFRPPRDVRVHDGAFFVNEDQVYLGDGTTVLPGAVVDASDGPVFIGANCRVEPHAAITGPCAIGANSVVLAGKITGSSIGHTCRVGGEVEESIFQAYVNKYHDGFVGHAYVGEWVNFGAMTTNSDLKNNYSAIRVSVNGEMTDSGSIKVGSFIGDHTKFGIGTLLNTGISIGVCANVFGGSLVSDKEVPSFKWGTTGNWTDYRLDKALDTARRTVGRRNVELTEREEELLRAISEHNLSAEGVATF